MNLNMDEINKLNPPGLLNLRPMEFVVEVITNLIAAQIAGSAVMLKLVRVFGRCQKQVRDNEAYNLNVKIKAWVLAKAARRAWVRGIIGEAAIGRWQVRYNNLAHPVEVLPIRRNKARSAPKSDVLPYTWKRFAMADLSWLETRPFPARNTSMPTSSGGWQQSRASRGFKPVEFYPFELAADYQPDDDGHSESPNKGDEKPIREQGVALTVPDPPPKRGVASENSQNKPNDTEHKPP